MNAPLDPLSIDLSGLLGQPGTTTVSSQSIDAGISTQSSLQTSAGVEISLDPTGGLSAVVEGGIAADTDSYVYGSYDSVEAAADIDAGTTYVSMTSADGSAYADAGFEAGGGLGITLSPGDGGLPDLDIATESGIDTHCDYGMHGSYDTTEIHQDNSVDIG
ncbi:hypothetical protein ABIC28_001609 [Rhodococcus sp. PvR044]|uniref:hypothetical protein n=1 Tax=Rhodococcus sp. PvR044 TaxID=3156402 RepID=UPI0033953533